MFCGPEREAGSRDVYGLGGEFVEEAKEETDWAR